MRVLGVGRALAQAADPERARALPETTGTQRHCCNGPASQALVPPARSRVRRVTRALALVGLGVAAIGLGAPDGRHTPDDGAEAPPVTPASVWNAPPVAAVASQPAEDRAVTGWIIDGAGHPIGGVAIKIRDAAGTVSATIGESEVDGGFHLALPGIGEETLLLDGPEVFPAELAWLGGDPPPRIMLARRVSLEARVTAGGGPVAGAEVRLSDGSSPVLATEITGDDGVARFADLLPGPYELWAHGGGAASPLHRTVRGGAELDAAIDLPLAPAGSVRGQVIGAGAPPCW